MGAVQPHRLMPRAAAHGSPLWRGGQGVHWSKPRAPPVRLRGEGDPRVDDRPREFKELMTVGYLKMPLCVNIICTEEHAGGARAARADPEPVTAHGRQQSHARARRGNPPQVGTTFSHVSGGYPNHQHGGVVEGISYHKSKAFNLQGISKVLGRVATCTRDSRD
jgi:hypothetical protein